MKFRKYKIWAIIIIALTGNWMHGVLANSPSFNRKSAVITLRENVLTSDSMVTLGTIADIQCQHTAFFEKLRDIEMGRAPLPGQTKIFDIKYVKLRLRQHQIDLSQIIFRVPFHSMVSTKALEIATEQLCNFARTYIQEHLLPDAERISVELSAKSMKIVVPDGKVSFRVPVPKGKVRLSKSTSIPIQIIVNGNVYKTFFLPLKVKAFKKVVVAAQDIQRQKHISKADVSIQERDIILIVANVIIDESLAIGKRAKRKISSGEILTDRIIEIPPVINRGDFVTILAQTPHLKITTLGEAREDGYMNGIIRVQNITSKKIISARVIGEKLVQVALRITNYELRITN